MAHCFRWKIVLPRTKRLGIDTSDHTLYERDAQRVWLGALNFKKNSDLGSCWSRRLRSSCVAAGMPLRRRQRQRHIGGGRYLNSPSPDGTSRPTSEIAHQGVASFFRPGSAS
jgi:hypothetical protein